MNKDRSLLRGVSLGLLLCFVMTGCSTEWRRKFIRRRKTATPAQPVLLLQSDVQATGAPDVRYREHFAYWKSWHSELLLSLGESRKRDLSYLNGTIGELLAMAQLLSGPPGERMKSILNELNDLQESRSHTHGAWQPTPAARACLEQLKREIDKNLHFSKVKEWIPR